MLNEEQREAINTLDGPVLIIAGPGTGKTKTLVERIANILTTKKTAPQKIILTTFTNKAAAELKIRINKKLKEIGQDIDISSMYIGTMHSIWRRLIEENIHYSRFFQKFEIMKSNYEQYHFIYKNLKHFRNVEGYNEYFQNVKISIEWEKVKHLVKRFNTLNENCIYIGEIRGQDKLSNFLKNSFELYEELLIENNKMDFSYLQMEFYNMLITNKNLLEKLNDKFDYLLIDEYQDSNRIQEKILFLLSRNKKNICVVGDEDQSIYRFRGATVKNILNFPNNFSENECKKIFLKYNYRSTNDIVEFSSRWINKIDWEGWRYDKKIVANNLESVFEKSVFRISSKTANENVSKIVDFVINLKKNEKISNYNQVAILFSSFRGNKPKDLVKEFLKNKIKVFSPRSRVFFESKEIKISLGIILGLFKKYVNIDKDSYLKDCLDCARMNLRGDNYFIEWSKKRIELLDSLEFKTLNHIFYELFQFDYYKEIFSNIEEKDLIISNLKILSKMFNNYTLESNNAVINSENNFFTIKYFFEKHLRMLRSVNIQELLDEEDFPTDHILFLTIHQSKGLEFPVVIVPSLNESPKLKNIDDSISSIDRMFEDGVGIYDATKEKFDFYRKYYVAFTRAKNLLILASEESSVSNVFKETFYDLPSINSLEYSLENLTLDVANDLKNEKLISFNADIKLYEECPTKYFFARKNNFFKFNNNIFTLGDITHQAIEYINRIILEDYKRRFSRDELENIVTKIYKINKKELDKNLERIIKIIEEYLNNAFIEFKSISRVESTEYIFNKDYILNGNIDLLLSTDEEVKIFDFKTGKKQDKFFEIYLEQLAFYKLLIKDNNKKDIKTFLYYLEEENPIKEIVINDNDFEKLKNKFEKIVENIIDENFKTKTDKIENCKECEFKYYCYGGKDENSSLF